MIRLAVLLLLTACAPSACSSCTQASVPPELRGVTCIGDKSAWVPMAESPIEFSESSIIFWTHGLLYHFSSQGAAAFDPCDNRWLQRSSAWSPSTFPTRYVSPMFRRHGTVSQNNALPPPLVNDNHVVFLWFGEQYAGSVYDLVADHWASVGPPPLVAGRRRGRVVAITSSGVVVWGGIDQDGKSHQDGAVLDPETATWRPMATTGAATARSGAHSAHLDAGLLVWGGLEKTGAYKDECWRAGMCRYADSGALYDPAHDRWRLLPELGAPTPRRGGTSSASGNRFFVFGGKHERGVLLDGAIYDATNDTWRAMAPFPWQSDIPKAGNAAFEFEFPRSAVEAGRYFVLYGRKQVMVYDTELEAWRQVEGQRPDTLVRSTLGERSAFIAINARSADLPFWRSPAPATAVFAVDPAASKWLQVALPSNSLARISPHTASLWVKGHLLLWGNSDEVPDPNGSDGCKGVTHACDPTIPTMTVFSHAGAMIEP